MNTKVIKRSFNKIAKAMKKHSPEILLGIGAVGSVAAVVEAAVQTPKAMDILKKHEEEMETFKKVKEEHKNEYSEKDYKKDVVGLYIRTTGKLVKVYAPAILTEVGALVCIFSSHHIMSERNKTLAAALTTISEAYSQYRNRVIEKFGEEVDDQIRFGDHEEEIPDENGKKKKRKENVSDPRLITESLYARIFDRNCHGYEENDEFRYKYLHDVENWLNEKLNTRGATNPNAKLYLSEVYKELDIDDSNGHGESSPEARVTMWRYDPNNPHKILLRPKDKLVRHAMTPERYSNHDTMRLAKITIIDPNVEGVDPDILA